MNRRHSNKAFTLIEILVATALILSIVSMVYASYVTTSKSARIGQVAMAQLQQGQRVIEQLTGQIRGSCLPLSAKTTVDEKKTTAATNTAENMMAASPKAVAKTQRQPVFFKGNSTERDGQILQIVTANAFSSNRNVTDGLFEVAYRFDHQRGRLWLSRQPFNPTVEEKTKHKTWQLIAENIDQVKLTFFDGKRWLDQWDFKNEKKLPNAVKIEIRGRSGNHRSYRLATTAQICCSIANNNETRLDGLLSPDK